VSTESTFPATTPADPDTGGKEPGSEPAGTEQNGTGGQAGVDALPEWARKAITTANAEAANYRTRLREAEQKLGDAKTVDEFQTAVAEVRAENERLEHEVLRERVARRFELPDDLAARLQGATAEELEADAKTLKKYATPAPSAPASLAGGLDPSDDGDTETDPRALARRYGGRRR
jgi:hypothetical protein